jgi:dienelactone hydrolase
MDGSRFLTSQSSDGSCSFEVVVLEAARPSRTALFAAGRGGDPRRHLPLLHALAQQGCTVIAPHFEPLASPVPREDEMQSRARSLESAIRSFAREGLPIAGIGHSIGATMLLVMAGGHAQTLAGQKVSMAPKINFDRLVLFTPAMDFFRAPGALASVDAPILLWAGAKDTVTPPTQAAFLKEALEPTSPVEVRLVEEAGHFTFMHDLPPHIADPHPDRDAFLTSLTNDVCRFVAS